LYIAIAVVAAKLAYRKAKKDNPGYFSTPRTTRPNPFKVDEARGVLGLVMDDAIDKRGFSTSTVRAVNLVKIMYLTAPLALVLFVVGIVIR
jgi:hypothetical protein